MAPKPEKLIPECLAILPPGVDAGAVPEAITRNRGWVYREPAMPRPDPSTASLVKPGHRLPDCPICGKPPPSLAAWWTHPCEPSDEVRRARAHNAVMLANAAPAGAFRALEHGGGAR